MAVSLDVQIATEHASIPAVPELNSWASKIPCGKGDFEVCVRVVDRQEIVELNKNYRKIAKATNVLSFPAKLPEVVDINFLGDVVICAEVVSEEAQEQNKEIKAHWAHMLVHGVLHLQGYDHQTDTQANEMENLEVKILESLGIDNPY